MITSSPQIQAAPTSGIALFQRYLALRGHTEALVASLSPEDLVVQSMPDASPGKWHLGHTTWFFETFLLSGREGYPLFDADFGYLFNSYYEALGPRQPRPQRGLMTRPAFERVMDYRRHVDRHMQSLLEQGVSDELAKLVELGIAHEEQHQELLQMDLLHLFSRSALAPAYDPHWTAPAAGRRGRFLPVLGGMVALGNDGTGFTFDNELPRHQAWLDDFEISDRLVTNGEWQEFIHDGGYRQPAWWLADGWALVQEEGWQAPLYWRSSGAGWQEMTPAGLQPLDPQRAVVHVSYHEAAAYAQWRGARLPTEAEWERAAALVPLQQVADVAWQWTASAYAAYPGFRAARDAVGEYNGKFMVSQMVLRGGAAATPPGHARLTYRNFYRPEQRWMFSGLRLARDARSEAAVEPSTFAADVRAGLSLKQKALSPKYFYDGEGSALFEAICLTDEYYPTRTETALLRDIAAEIALSIPEGAALVEFGSGASDKTRLLLDAAPQIAAYVPVDISTDALDQAALRLRSAYPGLAVAPVAADFTGAFDLPEAVRGKPLVGFFPGSTIGNFLPEQAVDFLRSARRLLGDEAMLIVGADLVKDATTLVAAYDDAAGVTARFNKNLLAHMNRELGGDFDPDAFRHEARWNADLQRMEMHLVSGIDQIVNAAGLAFAFKAGESIHTENSHKFTGESFAALARQAGWRVAQQWSSSAPAFAVFGLVGDAA